MNKLNFFLIHLGMHIGDAWRRFSSQRARGSLVSRLNHFAASRWALHGNAVTNAVNRVIFGVTPALGVTQWLTLDGKPAQQEAPMRSTPALPISDAAESSGSSHYADSAESGGAADSAPPGMPLHLKLAALFLTVMLAMMLVAFIVGLMVLD